MVDNVVIVVVDGMNVHVGEGTVVAFFTRIVG